jgi:hypothetical protein
MKLKTTDYENAEQYKSVVMCCAHVPPEDIQIVRDLIDHDKWWIHQIGADFDGAFIMRFGAVESEWDDIEAELSDVGFSDEFIGLLEELHTQEFGAVHFDPDAPLLYHFHWYTDSGAKVIPLGYDLWIERDDSDNDYFEMDGVKHYVADFMRLSDESEMKEYGYHAYAGESNTSALFIALSDDSDKVEVVRYV